MTARLCDLKNQGSSQRILSGHTEAILSVAITPDGRWALTGSVDILHNSGILQMQEVVLASF